MTIRCKTWKNVHPLIWFFLRLQSMCVVVKCCKGLFHCCTASWHTIRSKLPVFRCYRRKVHSCTRMYVQLYVCSIACCAVGTALHWSLKCWSGMGWGKMTCCIVLLGVPPALVQIKIHVLPLLCVQIRSWKYYCYCLHRMSG